MQEQINRNNELLSAIQAQTLDIAWVLRAGALLGLNSDIVVNSFWDVKNWDPSWGNIEWISKGPKTICVWYRTDGGEPLADVSDNNRNIRSLRFALLGELIKGLQAIGQLSYVRVGFPECWKNCRIYCDGREMELVISADALLGVVKQHYRDPKGKLVISKDGDSFDHQRVAGYVEIKVDKTQQPFF